MRRDFIEMLNTNNFEIYVFYDYYVNTNKDSFKYDADTFYRWFPTYFSTNTSSVLSTMIDFYEVNKIFNEDKIINYF